MSPTQLLDKMGIGYQTKSSRLQILCPFHHDRNPSAGFYLDTERFFCFSCEMSLDMVGFYAKIHETNRQEAAKELGLEADPPRGMYQQKAELARGRAERFLRTKQSNLPRKDHAKLGEKLDEIFGKVKAKDLAEEIFFKELSQWYELVEITGDDSSHRGTDLI